MTDQLAQRRAPLQVGDWTIPYHPHGGSPTEHESGRRVWGSHMGDAGGFRWTGRTTDRPGCSPSVMVQGWVRMDCSRCGREWRNVIIGFLAEHMPVPDFGELCRAYLRGGCGGCGVDDHTPTTCPMGDGFETAETCSECGHNRTMPSATPWSPATSGGDA